MKVLLNGYAFEKGTPTHIKTEYYVPDYLTSDTAIYAYLQMAFEKSGWVNFLFTFSHEEEE